MESDDTRPPARGPSQSAGEFTFSGGTADVYRCQMPWGRKLTKAFYARTPCRVAQDLVGCVLVRRLEGGGTLAARIIEVEAYLGDGSDPSSHAHVGPTPRNRSMFGPPGRLYAYKSYGIHTCANVVCEAEGIGAAVLLRAAEPLRGIEIMRAHRGLDSSAGGRSIASGPGRLAQALGLGIEDDGMSILGRQFAIYRARDQAVGDVESGPRIGISKATQLPYRYFVSHHPLVSGPRNPGARRRSTR